MGSLPAWCACAGDLRGRQSLAEDPFFKGGGVLLLWTGRAPKGHCWFSGQPGALAGATASCRFCSSLDRGFLQANLIPFTSPLLGSAPPQVNFFFFFGLWNTELCVSCQPPKTTGCPAAFVPDAQALLV